MAAKRSKKKHPDRPITLADVAAKAGVSKMTVSRVVNQDPRVSPTTKAKITAAIDALGFVPRSSIEDGRRRLSRSCQGMHHGRIATLIPDTNLIAMQTPLSGRLLIGIDRALGAHNLQMLMTRLPAPQTLPSFLTPRQVDGVIIRFGQTDWLPEVVAACGVPAVYLFGIGFKRPQDNVNTDDLAVGRLSAEYLIRRGATTLWWCDHWTEHAGYQIRRQGFLAAAAAAGRPVRQIDLHDVPMADWVARILAELPGDAATFGLATPATGALSLALSEVGRIRSTVAWKIPVVTCSHDFNATSLLPHPVANIDIQAELMGQTAVDVLIRRLGDRAIPAQSVIIPPVLVEIG